MSFLDFIANYGSFIATPNFAAAQRGNPQPNQNENLKLQDEE
jgi:hypothetical protein